ncbi:unnamed protein product [Arabis nemorensis]|uniref:Cytochrome P450 n=1 Tax=Arabis nemorensis TaxID=586526 RepID=A0A565BTQ8_9BRAS|nr:unnamed protein product [Arabis nemorensis]
MERQGRKATHCLTTETSVDRKPPSAWPLHSQPPLRSSHATSLWPCPRSCNLFCGSDAAKDILKTHDRIFASRPQSKIFQKLLYDGPDVAVAPYGEYWRQMKSVCSSSLLDLSSD